MVNIPYYELKTNISPGNPMLAMTQPYFTPGGKALEYFYSLRIWLTKRKSKAAYVTDETGLRIGSEVSLRDRRKRMYI
jgi:hypothetical protein